MTMSTLALPLVLAAAPTRAPSPHWAEPPAVPVERLVQNLASYTREHPSDPEGHYLLGRVHGLAFWLESRALRVLQRGPLVDGELPRLAPDLLQEHQLPMRRFYAEFRYPGELPPDDARPAPDARREHLEKALESFRRAAELAPEDARVHLGLAYVLQRGAHLADQVDTVVTLRLRPPELSDDEKNRIEVLIELLGADEARRRGAAFDLLARDPERAARSLRNACFSADARRAEGVRRLLGRLWRTRARDEYRRAYELSIEADLAVDVQPSVNLRQLIGYEAGSEWLALTEELAERSDALVEDMQVVRAALARLQGLPRVVTPIVLALSQARSLDELLAPGTSVCFDLDGDGRDELWPWLAPHAGLLVWDPKGEGRVTSGRTLFGNATWWLLFPDGYRALDALDDDRDGTLAGNELEGLALWRDADQDGVSAPGEVLPLETFGITALGTRPTGREGRALRHDAGVTLADGTRLASWDWVADERALRP